jgi:3',5'-cyclic-AMP phosphodiesterase
VPGEIKIVPRNPDCIRVIQITDTHIFASAEADFDGLDTSASLDAVIDHIKQKRVKADMVLVTGDLVHDPVLAAYQKLEQQLESLGLPTFCLPGNHDDPALMHSLLNQTDIHTNKVIKAGEWCIVLLDSFLEGSHSGRLQEQEIEFLQQNLQGVKEESILLCLHHPPVSIESSWMDAMMLENPEDLFSVIDEQKAVRAIIWGHIHQVFRKERNGVVLYGSPSTCIQFKPKSDEFIRDELGPAYSILLLHKDGRVEIETVHI